MMDGKHRILEETQIKLLESNSQVLEFFQGLLRREHIDQTDDLQS